MTESSANCNINKFRTLSQKLLSYSWKKVGNEKQLKFDVSLEIKFDSAVAAIDRRKLDKAKQELQEVKKLLAERPKFVKIADRTE